MRLAEASRRLSREARRRIEYAMQAVDGFARRLVHPAARLQASRQSVAHLLARLSTAAARRLEAAAAEIGRLRASLSGLDPGAVLERGYSITRDQVGNVIRDAARVREGERLRTTLAKGWLESEVKKAGS